MRITAVVLGAAAAIVMAGCSGHELSNDGPLAGVWGSGQAGLNISDGAATLQITSDGNCYGSYAVTTRSIPNGQFAVPGTYTQLMGAYPGKVDYPAQLTGTVTGNQLLHRDQRPIVAANHRAVHVDSRREGPMEPVPLPVTPLPGRCFGGRF